MVGQYALGIHLFFFQELVVEWNFAAILIKVGLCCAENFGNIGFKIEMKF